MGSGASKKKQTTKATVMTVGAFSSHSKNVSAYFNHPLSKTKGSLGVLLSCHSKDAAMAAKISEVLQKSGFDPLTATETVPSQLSYRENVVQWAEVVVILASIKYQRNETCLELSNYAKDTKKPIKAVIVQQNFCPSGALGAISIAGGNPISVTDQNGFDQDMNKLVKALNELVEYQPNKVLPKPKWDDRKIFQKFGNIPGDGSGVFVSYHEDGANSARLIKNGRGKTISISPTLGIPNKDNLPAIKACETFIAIMSTGYQKCDRCQEEFECARAGKKKIVPVKGVEGFRPTGWLALAIAGKLYYEILNEDQAYRAYTNVPDSNPMNDFVYAVYLKPYPHEDEVEKTEIAALKKQLAEAKEKLGGNWPPKKRPPEKQEELLVLKPEDLVLKKDDNLPFNYIHHEVTRMTFNPPKPLFDDRGVPIKQKFDVMLSYQWDIQSFVRNVYMDLDMRSFKAWMDIWGEMLGNINR